MNLPITNEQVSTGEKKREMRNWLQTCHKNTEFCLQESDPRPCTSCLGEGRMLSSGLTCLQSLGSGEWWQCHLIPVPLTRRKSCCCGHVLPCVKHAQYCLFRGLRGCFSLLPAKSWVLLWAVCTGMCEPWGWVTAAETAACIWQRALEGTIKKLFAQQLKILIKSLSIWMARGKKGSIQSSAFLLNFQFVPPFSCCSLGQWCISACTLHLLVPRLTAELQLPELPHNPSSTSSDQNATPSSLHPLSRVRGSSRKPRGRKIQCCNKLSFWPISSSLSTTASARAEVISTFTILSQPWLCPNVSKRHCQPSQAEGAMSAKGLMVLG